MSTVESFAQYALQNHVAPPSVGKIEHRFRRAARVLGWTYSRVKDVWYADPRVSLRGHELVKIEQVTGLRYAQKELGEVEAYIARAEALLASQDEDFHRPFLAAMRAFFRAMDRTGTEE